MNSLRLSQLLGVTAALVGSFLVGCDSGTPPSRSSTTSNAPSGIPGLMPEPSQTPLSATFSQENQLPPAGAPLPPPAPPSLAETPSQPVLAPEGVYFVTENISIMHDAGVIGIAPGTRVRLVKRNGPLMLVSDGKNQFEVSPDQVTNDTVAAQKLLQFDQANQSTLAEIQAQQKTALLEQERQRRMAFERHVSEIVEEKQAKEEAQASANASKPKYESPLDRGAYNQTRTWRYDIYGRYYWVDIYGRRHYHYRYSR